MKISAIQNNNLVNFTRNNSKKIENNHIKETPSDSFVRSSKNRNDPSCIAADLVSEASSLKAKMQFYVKKGKVRAHLLGASVKTVKNDDGTKTYTVKEGVGSKDETNSFYRAKVKSGEILTAQKTNVGYGTDILFEGGKYSVYTKGLVQRPCSGSINETIDEVVVFDNKTMEPLYYIKDFECDPTRDVPPEAEDIYDLKPLTTDGNVSYKEIDKGNSNFDSVLKFVKQTLRT